MSRKRLTEQSYISLANSRGFKWIGIFPPDTNIPTMWECCANHVWETRYHNISAGHGCPKCAGKERLAESDYRKLANEREFIWLGLLPKNNRTKTRWRCSSGHDWSATYSNVSHGSGCPRCANIKIRNSRIGDKHYKWRGGSKTQKHYGNGFNEKKRKEIRMRDNYTCMLTGEYFGNNGKKPDIHHIVPVRVAPSNWKNNDHNLITLSRKMNIWADDNLKESIPLLRKILHDIYGYGFSDMQDYDLSLLTQASI